MFLRLFAFVIAVLLLAPVANAGDFAGSGLKKLAVVDPVDSRPMEAVVFFPSPANTDETQIGPYRLVASPTAPIAEGHFPVILLSHGTMGSMWGHHDLAEGLARNGNIVVTVTHPGDNFKDPSRLGTTSSTYGRPMQISAALNSALEDTTLAPHIDKDRIGFVGFSAGGTTGLILAGAKPDLSGLEHYCAQRPDDHSVCEAKGKIRIDRPNLTPKADPRIGAYVFLAPLSVIFAPDSLKAVKAPTLIYVGDRDEELSSKENAVVLASELPKAQLQIIEQAGHFTFLAPCSTELAEAAPVLCTDNPGLDRTALHERINIEIAAFFDKTLGKPN
ncbi:chlorophyllase enzyme family protein [Ochrobactrum quorumnocens]|uniref:Chlorophyllase enzyme family protein n=1 Tax=Ochrobactrum quorumnocens TaxID=271865 RepID=A0A248UMK1_9HYPH|nr:dienelactone hydrolase [[Ochrobactrum] quorumnocens]ASV87509.1 chlorophyllase enzyme family protein [[Ochrobactrum] quorumnocens]